MPLFTLLAFAFFSFWFSSTPAGADERSFFALFETQPPAQQTYAPQDETRTRSRISGNDSRTGRRPDPSVPRHDHRRYKRAGALSLFAERQGVALWCRRWARRLYVARAHTYRSQGKLAFLDAAGSYAEAPSRSAALHDRGRRQPAWSARDVSLFGQPRHGIQDSRVKRTMDDRPRGVLGLHQNAEPGCQRSVQPRESRRHCGRALRQKKSPGWFRGFYYWGCSVVNGASSWGHSTTRLLT